MPGAPDPVYVEARQALLDMLEALGEHRDAFVLVGAQAIYMHVGESDLAIAPYTSDADLALDPRILADQPQLEQLLRARGFVSGEATGMIGTWLVAVGGGRSVPVDLLVPEALATKGRRSAKLGDHGARTARWAKGLEAAVVDKEQQRVAAMEESDHRAFDLWVAGPAALLVAKLHKIAERVDDMRRLQDKDALDVYRLLHAIAPSSFAEQFARIRMDETCRAVAAEGLELLNTLFANSEAPGCTMVARALFGLEDEAFVKASCAALAADVLQAIDPLGAP